MALPIPTFDDGAHSVELAIDLSDLFGVDSIDEALAMSIGADLVERIVDITESGRSPKGASFKKYDEDYIESEEFKAAGKSSSEVNLTLYGDMLAQLEPIRVEGGRVILGWNDTTQQKKAYAHMTGFKGHPTIKNGPRREFLAVTQGMLDDIRERYIDQIKRPDEQQSSFVLSALEIFNRTRESDQQTRERSLISLLFGNQ